MGINTSPDVEGSTTIQSCSYDEGRYQSSADELNKLRALKVHQKQSVSPTLSRGVDNSGQYAGGTEIAVKSESNGIDSGITFKRDELCQDAHVHSIADIIGVLGTHPQCVFPCPIKGRRF